MECAHMKMELGNHEAERTGHQKSHTKPPKAIKIKRFQLLSSISGLAEEEVQFKRRPYETALIPPGERGLC